MLWSVMLQETLYKHEFYELLVFNVMSTKVERLGWAAQKGNKHTQSSTATDKTMHAIKVNPFHYWGSLEIHNSVY